MGDCDMLKFLWEEFASVEKQNLEPFENVSFLYIFHELTICYLFMCINSTKSLVEKFVQTEM